jgi:hypothetical protein
MRLVSLTCLALTAGSLVRSPVILIVSIAQSRHWLLAPVSAQHKMHTREMYRHHAA